MDLDQHEVLVYGQPVDLTPTEFKLLRALMENPDHAFTRSELIEKNLGYTYQGLDRTLDSHIKNLRRKIKPDPAKPTYIQTVYGVGLQHRLRGEPFDPSTGSGRRPSTEFTVSAVELLRTALRAGRAQNGAQGRTRSNSYHFESFRLTVTS